MNDTLTPASVSSFSLDLDHARATSTRRAEALSPSHEIPSTARYWLSEDHRSGFGVTQDGTLIALFSLEKGRGDDLVTAAIAAGAKDLDCFDGYLVDFYARHGFVETRREANWTPGEPDVVFMARAAG
ncbi:MAG: hypothetical protein M3Q39_15990 [Actinomycetota bacterium]|nr:hypothetical protein [Actinomycetota bacterium]